MNDNHSFLRNSPKMIRRPTDQNGRPCLLPCPEGVATGSRPAERPPTLKQQVRDTQMWHKHTLIEREIMRPPLPITHLTIHKGVIMFFVCVCGRRRYGAWTGYSAAAPGGHRAAEKRLPLRTGWVRPGCTDRRRRTLCSSVTHGRVRDGEESKYVLPWVDSRGGGREGGTGRLNGREEERDKERQLKSVSVTHFANCPVAFKNAICWAVQSLRLEQREGLS